MLLYIKSGTRIINQSCLEAKVNMQKVVDTQFKHAQTLASVPFQASIHGMSHLLRGTCWHCDLGKQGLW
jgi:hypothetical protein